MRKPKVYLFTSPTCPHCPSAKQFMEKYKNGRDDFVYQNVTSITSEGHKLSKKYNVMSVPTFIIDGPGYPTPIGLRGVQNKKIMDKYIAMSRGEIKEEQKAKKEFKIGKFKIKF